MNHPLSYYSSLYGGSLIGKVHADGSAYDSAGSYVGRFENEYVYRGALGESVIARYDKNGIVYEGMNSYDILGEVAKDGIVYEHVLAGRGKPIAKVDGMNTFIAGAIYLALFR